MRLFGFLVAMLVVQVFVARPALGQARGRVFNAGGSTTGAIGGPSTQGTSTTGSTDLLGNGVLGGSSGTGRVENPTSDYPPQS